MFEKCNQKLFIFMLKQQQQQHLFLKCSVYICEEKVHIFLSLVKQLHSHEMVRSKVFNSTDHSNPFVEVFLSFATLENMQPHQEDMQEVD